MIGPYNRKDMNEWRRRLAMSDSRAARGARALRRMKSSFGIPFPRWLVRAPVLLFLWLRSTYYFLFRVFVAEPFFRSYCTRAGRNFHTGAHLHWVMGAGTILIGDNVTIDGKCNFFFAVRYARNPTLRIGHGTGVGHSCSFTVGREISIGNNCRIGGGVVFFDTPGHPTDPRARLEGSPADADDVRAIEIGDNVWIGSGSIVFPGVTIGCNSVVAYGSVVMSNVPENVVVAGNPARQIARIQAGQASSAT